MSYNAIRDGVCNWKEPIELGSTAYVCGPMRGQECFNFKNFFYWQVVLEKSGYKVINPAEIDCKAWINDGWIFTDDQHAGILEKDCEIIRNEVDFLFVLTGWENSVGANKEIATAEEKGILIVYEDHPIT